MHKEGICQNCGFFGRIYSYQLCNSCYHKFLIWKQDAHGKELHRRTGLNYYHRHKDDPIWQEHTNAVRRIKYAKNMEDPKFVITRRIKAKQKYYRKLQDPEERKKYNERAVRNYHKRMKDPKFREHRRNLVQLQRRRETRGEFWEMAEREIGFKLDLEGNFGF